MTKWTLLKKWAHCLVFHLPRAMWKSDDSLWVLDRNEGLRVSCGRCKVFFGVEPPGGGTSIAELIDGVEIDPKDLN